MVVREGLSGVLTSHLGAEGSVGVSQVTVGGEVQVRPVHGPGHHGAGPGLEEELAKEKR